MTLSKNARHGLSGYLVAETSTLNQRDVLGAVISCGTWRGQNWKCLELMKPSLEEEWRALHLSCAGDTEPLRSAHACMPDLAKQEHASEYSPRGWTSGKAGAE